MVEEGKTREKRKKAGRRNYASGGGGSQLGKYGAHEGESVTASLDRSRVGRVAPGSDRGRSESEAEGGVGGAHGMRAEGGTSRVGRAAARAEGAMGMVRWDERKVERCGQAYERQRGCTQRSYAEEGVRSRKLSSRHTRAEGRASRAKGGTAIAEDNALQYLPRKNNTRPLKHIYVLLCSFVPGRGANGTQDA